MEKAFENIFQNAQTIEFVRIPYYNIIGNIIKESYL